MSNRKFKNFFDQPVRKDRRNNSQANFNPVVQKCSDLQRKINLEPLFSERYDLGATSKNETLLLIQNLYLVLTPLKM